MNVQAFNKISIVVAENCAIKQKMAMGIGFLQKKNELLLGAIKWIQ